MQFAILQVKNKFQNSYCKIYPFSLQYLFCFLFFTNLSILLCVFWFFFFIVVVFLITFLFLKKWIVIHYKALEILIVIAAAGVLRMASAVALATGLEASTSISNARCRFTRTSAKIKKLISYRFNLKSICQIHKQT